MRIFMFKYILAICGLFILLFVSGCEPPAKRINPPRTGIESLQQPQGLRAYDSPGDKGGSIILTWKSVKTENTPDFLIREEIRRRQFKAFISEKEKEQIRKAVRADYSAEPEIDYIVYSPKKYEGLMKVLAAFYSGETGKINDGVKAFQSSWKKYGNTKRLEIIISLIRFSRDILDDGGGPAWKTELKKWREETRKLGFADKCDKLEEYIKSNLVGRRDVSDVSVSLTLKLLELARIEGDIRGLGEIKPSLEFKKKPYGRFRKGLNDMGTRAVRKEASALLERLMKENRARLAVGEDKWLADLKSSREIDEKTLKKGLGPVYENMKERFLEMFSKSRLKVIENIEANVEWGLLQKFNSSVNFKKETPSACEWRESGEDAHYFQLWGMEDGVKYRFRVELQMGENKINVQAEDGGSEVAAVPGPDWFYAGKLNLLIVVALLGTIIILFLWRAKRNPNMFLRKIAGLDAVDDSIGRATEMGRDILYLMGNGQMSDLPTIASANILSRVAREAAKHNTKLKVPCFDPVVMSVARDIVKEAYLAEGKIDDLSNCEVFFVSQDPFSYAANVDGVILRDKPATNLMMGQFGPEALLISEVGASQGMIQVSGTNEISQLPFFITTTDYTLIGEELFAASAYLSRNSKLLGNLKGQDAGKLLLIIVIILGTILSTLGFDILVKFFE